uniref:C2H2-type domain-containing protein n=1 Tax=Lygus hesperus TaxID=30085 RepID=A0A0K8SHN2_LYGHE
MDEVSDCELLTGSGRNFECEHCKERFESDSFLKAHLKERHSPFACYCGAKFAAARYLSKHQSRHTAYPKVPCRLCGRTFINNTEMKEHQKSHNVGEKIRCTACDYVTLYKSNMTRHMIRT